MTTEELQARIEQEAGRKLRRHMLQQQATALHDLRTKAKLLARNLEGLDDPEHAETMREIVNTIEDVQWGLESAIRAIQP